MQAGTQAGTRSDAADDRMIHLTGATVVQPAGLLSPATLTIEGDRIAEITAGRRTSRRQPPATRPLHRSRFRGRSRSRRSPESTRSRSADAVARIARHLPRHGVTAFCPTSIACDPAVLRTFLESVRVARVERARQQRRGSCPRTSKATSSIPSSRARSPKHASVVRGRSSTVSSPAKASFERSSAAVPTSGSSQSRPRSMASSN